MGTIGRIAVSLEAEYASFTQGTQQAAGDITHLGATAELASGGISSFFQSFTEGLGIGTGIEVAKAGFEALSEAVGESIAKVREWVGESLKTQQAAVRTAAALHVHVDTLEGLEAAGKRAGIGTDELSEALAKTNHAIGEAASKGGEGADALKKLGLSAKTLASESLDKGIGQIADALKNIKNPAEQAAAAGGIFGERLGPKLLPLLNQGSAGIAKITEEAKKAGVALDDVDAGKLAAAQASLDEVGEHFEGLKNQLTIALAPAIKAIADGIISILPPADKVKEFLMNAFNSIVLSIAETQDNLKGLEVGLLKLASIALKVSEVTGVGYLLGAGSAAAALDHVADSLDHKGSAAEAAAHWLQDIQDNAANAGKALESGIDQPIAAITNHIQDNTDKIQEALQKLHDSVAQFGLTEGQKDILSLKHLGADNFDLNTANDLNNQLNHLEQHKKDLAEAKHLIEESISPLDKYKQLVDETGKLWAEHLLTAKQRMDLLNKAQDELNKKQHADDKHSSAEVRRFDFNLGKTSKPGGLQGQILETEKRHALATDRIKFIQEQFYNNMLNKPQVVLYNF
jgi:hypothetical protein